MGRTGTLLYIPFMLLFFGFFALLGYQIYRGDKRSKPPKKENTPNDEN